jgi:hypothetical protein
VSVSRKVVVIVDDQGRIVAAQAAGGRSTGLSFSIAPMPSTGHLRHEVELPNETAVLEVVHALRFVAAARLVDGALISPEVS